MATPSAGRFGFGGDPTNQVAEWDSDLAGWGPRILQNQKIELSGGKTDARPFR